MILITGARGSIGSALMKRLPDAVGIDIEDWDITQPRHPANEIESQPDIVYHLAAAKDAPEGELDPEKVMRINAVGTANVLARWPNSRVVLASTCKACNPETAYGASKLIAERMVLNAGGWVARFHNVIETQGNVFQTWSKIEGSLPVTDCWRYFIHVDQAVDLLLKVPTLPPGRYMAEPGPLLSMANQAIQTYPGRDYHYIPLRRGDRRSEPLHAAHERIFSTQYNGILRVASPHD